MGVPPRISAAGRAAARGSTPCAVRRRFATDDRSRRRESRCPRRAPLRSPTHRAAAQHPESFPPRRRRLVSASTPGWSRRRCGRPWAGCCCAAALCARAARLHASRRRARRRAVAARCAIPVRMERRDGQPAHAARARRSRPAPPGRRPPACGNFPSAPNRARTAPRWDRTRGGHLEEAARCSQTRPRHRPLPAPRTRSASRRSARRKRRAASGTSATAAESATTAGGGSSPSTSCLAASRSGERASPVARAPIAAPQSLSPRV